MRTILTSTRKHNNRQEFSEILVLISGVPFFLVSHVLKDHIFDLIELRLVLFLDCTILILNIKICKERRQRRLRHIRLGLERRLNIWGWWELVVLGWLVEELVLYLLLLRELLLILHRIEVWPTAGLWWRRVLILGLKWQRIWYWPWH